ncbi:MAG: hypothetical protein PVS3B3_04220 [Ktedonobacteraceae bacterium]
MEGRPAWSPSLSHKETMRMLNKTLWADQQNVTSMSLLKSGIMEKALLRRERGYSYYGNFRDIYSEHCK